MISDVRWGIVGTGVIAEVFANALSLVKGAVRHGVTSRRREYQNDFAARHEFLHSYRTYEELLRDPEIDIVYVATRNEYHHEDSLAAVKAGKAVLCEKPFALDANQARNVIEAARQRHVFCMEAMWMRFSPAMREALDTVRSGAIGRPKLVSAQLGFPIHFDPMDRVFVKPGGGALFDFGVYCISFVQAFLGRPARIDGVGCIGPTGVDDQFSAVFEYESGCQALISASLRAQLENAASIHGTDGILDRVEPLYFPKHYHVTMTPPHTRGHSRPVSRITAVRQRVGSYVRRAVLGHDDTGHVISREVRNGYACEAAAVQQCLHAGLLESPDIPLEETVAVLESMDAIRSQWSVRR